MIPSIYNQQITNDPQFDNVERFVHIIADIRREGSIELVCTIQYFKDSVDITEKFSAKEFRLVANNSRRKTVYEQDGVTPVTETYEEQEVILGLPQYNIDEATNVATPRMITKVRNVTVGLYDYFKSFMSKPISTFSQYALTIELNAAQGKFD